MQGGGHLRRYFHYSSSVQSSLDTARSALDSAVREDPTLSDPVAMGAGVSTDGMRVAGFPVGVDAWVKTFVEKKARSVIIDVAKLDVV